MIAHLSWAYYTVERSRAAYLPSGSTGSVPAFLGSGMLTCYELVMVSMVIYASEVEGYTASRRVRVVASTQQALLAVATFALAFATPSRLPFPPTMPHRGRRFLGLGADDECCNVLSVYSRGPRKALSVTREAVVEELRS